MEQREQIRSDIERTDFPRVAEGYDREAVDDHLREVAETLARPPDGDASWRFSVAMADEVRTLGESAAARVEEIVAMAEKSATEIVQRAETQASATVEAAEKLATKITREGAESAARTASESETEAREARERARAQAGELREAIASASSLIERLGSASTVVGEFEAISSRMAPEKAPQADAGELAAEADPAQSEGEQDRSEEDEPSDDDGESDPPVDVWFSTIGDDGDEQAKDQVVSNGAAGTEEAGEEETAGEAVAPEGPEPPAQRSGESYRSHKMRMAAFNMLVRGSERDEVAAHLRESFELTLEDDELVEATLREAATRTREWKAVPNPLPKRRRFLGR